MTNETQNDSENNRGKTKEGNQNITGNQTTPWNLNEEYDCGSKSWGEIKRDRYQFTTQSIFPACSSARTTIYAREAEDEQHFTVLFKLQHGRQHPAEKLPNGYSEGWDGQKVRQENVYKYDRADTILSQAGVKGLDRKFALQKVMGENLQGFSRYYEGGDGAALGFAALYKYDDREISKNSYLVDFAEKELGIDGEMLMDYVWRKYGGDE
jgi:hypothetical protein